MSKSLISSGLVILTLLAIPQRAPAQNRTTAAVSGIVMDVDSVPLAGALLSLDAEQHTTTSSPSGRYRLEAIRPGHHSLVIRQIGFAPDSVDLDVAGGSRLTLTVVLRILPVNFDTPPATGPPATPSGRR